MEETTSLSKEKEKGDWIRVASKNKPGRFYMFNKATGETEWLPLNGEVKKDQTITKSPPLTNSIKTPAQDRLKRLQNNLKAAQHIVPSTRITRHTLNSKADIKKEQENSLNDQPSASSSGKSLTKSPKKAMKRSHHNLRSEDETILLKTASTDVTKKPKLLQHATKLTESTTKTETGTSSTNSNLTIANDTTEEFQSTDGDNTSTLSNLRSGIVRKIKEICKIPFNTTNKPAHEKLTAKEEKPNSLSLVKTNFFKAVKRLKGNHQNLSTSLTESIKHELKANRDKSFDLIATAASTSLSTTGSLNTPTYSRGSANSRLERLKQSLLSQQQQETDKESANTSIRPTSSQIAISSESIKDNDSLNTTDTNDMLVQSNSLNCLHRTASKTIVDDDSEAMDWQPSVRDEESSDKPRNIKPDSGLIIEKSKKFQLLLKDANDHQTMGDIYDAINENLLRYSAEKQTEATNSNHKWKTDFYYFIVDTNVLLRDLTFIEDLTKMKLCDTEGSMLYIPYSVLQELDNLKMRSGIREGTKTLAVRAIRYLNEKFEKNSSQIKAQSALDERKHLIDVNTADDSILNCCLQVKKHVNNFLLLTEDVNLRNKAICNNILVSTKSDLISKRFDSNDLHKNL